MKHLELHIIQSFPVSCLNRDDLNSPKTAVFGGVQRARVSSQSWKRAIRELARESLPTMAGQRTRLLVGGLVPLLRASGFPENASAVVAEIAAEQLSKIDTKKDSDGFLKVTTLCFLSEMELRAVADAITAKDELRKASEELEVLLILPKPDGDDEKKKRKEQIEKAKERCSKHVSKGDVAKAMKAVRLKDAADIALFGRMVANDHSLTVEGAAMFSHALSTHKVDNEIDFFSAVDDRQPSEEAGAGMTGTLEFNSATYYRFAAVNLDMLADKEHLAVLEREGRQAVVRAFIKATLEAIPGARRTSMNANTRPSFVLGIIRNAGHPIQLINAFESPVRPKSGDGFVGPSVSALKAEYEQMSARWCLKADEVLSVFFPDDVNLDEFLDRLVSHVS